MKLKLSEIKNTEPKRDHGNIQELADSIAKEGLLQPLVVNQHNELICGRRRFEAISLLGWKEVEVHKIYTKDEADKLSKAIAENVMRKNLTPSEKTKAIKELEKLLLNKKIQGWLNNLNPWFK